MAWDLWRGYPMICWGWILVGVVSEVWGLGMESVRLGLLWMSLGFGEEPLKGGSVGFSENTILLSKCIRTRHYYLRFYKCNVMSKCGFTKHL